MAFERLSHSIRSLFRGLPSDTATMSIGDDTAVQMLSQVGRAVASSLQGVAETHAILTEAVVSLLNAERGLLLLPGSNDCLIPAARSGNFDRLNLEALAIPVSAPLIGEAFRHGEIRHAGARDRKELSVYGAPDRSDLGAIAAVPLKNQNDTCGVIVADTKRDGSAFTATDLRILEVFATIASLVTSEARLIDDLRNRNVALESLFAMARQLNSQDSASNILQLAIQTAIAHTEATSGSIVYVDRAQRELIIKSAEGLPDGTSETIRLEIGQGVTGWVAREGESARIEDVSNDSRYVQIDAAIQSELAVPIRIDGEVFGVINVDSTQRAAFSDEHQTYLEALADLAAARLRVAFAATAARQANGT